MNLLIAVSTVQGLVQSTISAQNAPELEAAVNTRLATLSVSLPDARFLGMTIGGGGAGQQYVATVYVTPDDTVAGASTPLDVTRVSIVEATDFFSLDAALTDLIANGGPFGLPATLIGAENRVGGNGGSFIGAQVWEGPQV